MTGIITRTCHLFQHTTSEINSFCTQFVCWTQRKIFWRMWETEQFWGTIDFHSIFFPTMAVNGAPKQPGYKLSSKYLPLCSAEQRHSYRFGTTWGWVNDRILIFGWTIPLTYLPSVSKWELDTFKLTLMHLTWTFFFQFKLSLKIKTHWPWWCYRYALLFKLQECIK